MSNTYRDQQNEIKFSVIIPAYNAAETILRAISSIMAQSYPAHEIIVVDDASNDNTVALISSQYSYDVRVIQK